MSDSTVLCFNPDCISRAYVRFRPVLRPTGDELSVPACGEGVHERAARRKVSDAYPEQEIERCSLADLGTIPDDL